MGRHGPLKQPLHPLPTSYLYVLLFAAGASCWSNRRRKGQCESDSTPEAQSRADGRSEGRTEDSRTVTLEMRTFGREYISFCVAVMTKNKCSCLKQYECVIPSEVKEDLAGVSEALWLWGESPNLFQLPESSRSSSLGPSCIFEAPNHDVLTFRSSHDHLAFCSVT